jgi:hypothetical protein
MATMMAVVFVDFTNILRFFVTPETNEVDRDSRSRSDGCPSE